MDTDANWALEEFGQAELGDSRRTSRLVELALAFGACPGSSIPEASQSAFAAKAAYRFFSNDDIRAESILASHVLSTQRRIQSIPVVLAVQDTTNLDWNSHPATTGLGPLDARTHRGLMTHTTLALSPEQVPLGLLQQQVWARSETLRQGDHKTRPIEEKESRKWLESLEAVIQAKAACPQTHFVSVGDRESDVYDLFLVDRPAGVDLLVRAAQDRRTDGSEKTLWASMEAVPVAGEMAIRMGARADMPARHASLQVRWKQITLRPPEKRSKMGMKPVTVWAVWALEAFPPKDVSPVEWMLLTTMEVASMQEAQQRLDWYAARWGIEVWHKVLKSGCQIESRQLGTAERLERCLALYSVIAWRILYATMLARVAPEISCTVLLDTEEWKGLYCRIHRVQTPCSEPPTLKQAIRWIAELGGFLGRKSDGEPGVKVIWKGFQHLVDIAAMFKIFCPS